MEQLFKWAEKADEPLRTYATGLLAGAMELQDVAANFKEKNSALVSNILFIKVKMTFLAELYILFF